MAAVAAWLMMSFVAATLHTAPFEKESFGGVFTDSSRASTLTNPDLAWLSMAEKMLAEDKLGTDNSFSVNTYVSNYNRMREALDKEPSLRVKR